MALLCRGMSRDGISNNPAGYLHGDVGNIFAFLTRNISYVQAYVDKV